MLKVGITGQSGFIGTHLYNFLNQKKEDIITVPFQDSYFEDEILGICRGCDDLSCCHNRHGDQVVMTQTSG
jgi:UDP-2-acetamido-2,6-beta-L-arabino-hexul-4-ose reductase